MSYLKSYWPLSALAVIITLLQSYLAANLPLIMIRDMVDNVFVGGNHSLLSYYLILVVVIYSITSILSFTSRYLQSYVGQRAMADIRKDLVESLQKQSFSFFDRSQTGQLVARLTGDVEAINRLYFFFLTSLFSPVTTAVFSVYFLITVDIRLTLLSALSAPIILGLNYAYQKRVQPVWGKVRETWGRLNQYLQEFLVGIKVVRVFSREGYELDRFETVNNSYYSYNVEAAITRSIYSPLSDISLSLIISFIFWYGANEAIRSALTIGSLLVFSRYVSMLLQPFRNIGYFVSSYSRAVAGGSRIFSIMDTPSEVRNRDKALVLAETKGKISFENVCFSYEGGKNVLEDINLIVNEGESIAILGPTGSGKSTLVYLIPRFYDVTSGRITLDDRDVRDYTLESLRSQIGIVLQDIFLFSSSIKENIAFGRPEASMDDIVKAAKAAQAHDFITSLPKGYETMVGERGLTLSGGQRQRIAIARTLLTDPRLLILDDSTSFVDAETEASIQKTLDRLLQGRTSFIITHRLSTIRRVDRLVVLDKGRISEVGTHEELLKKRGTYSRIYETQFAEVERLSVKSYEGRR